MTEINQDFEMFSGDSRTLEITVRDSSGDVVDITGYSFKWEMSNGTSVTPTLIDGPTGRFDVPIAPANTSGVSGAFTHESQITSGAGAVSTIFTGAMTVKQDLIV